MLGDAEHAGDDQRGQGKQGDKAHAHSDSLARAGNGVRLNTQHGLAREWFRDTGASHENENAINAFHG